MASGSVFRSATPSGPNLFPVEKFQGSPRHIRGHVTFPVGRLDIGRLHEHVDVHHCIHALLLGAANAVASFRNGSTVIGAQAVLLSAARSVMSARGRPTSE